VYHALIKLDNRSILIETSNDKIRKKILTIIKNIFDIKNAEKDDIPVN